MSDSDAKPASAKGGSATQQIHAATQENGKKLDHLGEELAAVKEMIKDHQKILQELDTKMDSARFAAPKGGRAKGSGTSSKKDSAPAAPPIHIWFRQIWKEDEEGTTGKYCDEDCLEAIKKAIAANPKSKNKKGDMLKSALAGAYYTKHFAKRDSEHYQEEGHNTLKKDHESVQKEMEKGSDSGGDEDNE